MDISPYEFVGIQIESPIESLNANTGDFVVIPGVLFHWILKQQDRKQAFDDAVLAADLTLTVFTLGTYAGVKTAVKVGTQVTIAMTVDFICQAAIISLHSSKSFSEIKYSDIAWLGASSIITNSNYSIIVSPLRATILDVYRKNPNSVEEALLEASYALRTEIIVTLLTKGTIGRTKYLALLENTFAKGPKEVVDNLIKLRITPEIIQSVSEQFSNSILKETINNILSDAEEK